MITWWSVPCAADFVDGIVSDLSKGKCVVVCLPDPHPPGLFHVLQERLLLEHLFVQEVDACGCECGPMRLLASSCLSQNDIADDDHVERLLNNPDFQGRIFFVFGIGTGLWPQWSAFLTRYEEACRPMSVVDRSVICLFQSGPAALSPPREDVCLSVRIWRGHVTEADMLHYSWTRVRAKPWPVLHRKLAVAMAVKLAMWDPLFADFLLSRKLEEILDPKCAVEEYAHIRGWCDESVPSERLLLWAHGKADLFEDEWRLHPALMLDATRTQELRSRIWSAQVSVLMPILEEERLRLIQKHRRQIPLPYQTPWGPVDCAEDLELQHLATILCNLPRLESTTRRKARLLGKIRNKLAHLEPLAVSDFDPLL